MCRVSGSKQRHELLSSGLAPWCLEQWNTREHSGAALNLHRTLVLAVVRAAAQEVSHHFLPSQNIFETRVDFPHRIHQIPPNGRTRPTRGVIHDSLYLGRYPCLSTSMPARKSPSLKQSRHTPSIDSRGMGAASIHAATASKKEYIETRGT